MYSQPNGLGFSLKPPSWLRNIAGAAFKGTTVTVPTPSGTLSVDISNPAQLEMLKNAILGTRISKGPVSQTDPGVPAAAAAGIGIGTLVLIGLGAFLLLGRRRSRA